MPPGPPQPGSIENDVYLSAFFVHLETEALSVYLYQALRDQLQVFTAITVINLIIIRPQKTIKLSGLCVQMQ